MSSDAVTMYGLLPEYTYYVHVYNVFSWYVLPHSILTVPTTRSRRKKRQLHLRISTSKYIYDLHLHCQACLMFIPKIIQRSI